jgi:hypothetical protein
VNLDHKLVGLQIESYAGTPLHRRLADQQRFRELVVKHGANETLQVMIRAYGAAVRDPADEFIHLYEIRDALKKNFGAEDVAIAKLGGKDAEPHWGALGKLANSEPVLQGRHRGRKGISLRPATPEELANARDAALHLINAYLSYLDRP